MLPVASERELAGLARALLAPRSRVGANRRGLVAQTRVRIAAGEDPLGEALCALRTPAARRPLGATYTPAPIVEAMVGWAERAAGGTIARIVDPGAGSARFLVAAGRRFPAAELVAVEIDPLAALLARAHLAVAGLGGRARVRVGDYRELALGAAGGPTLFLGNPPYVRHHGIAPRWKKWLHATARRHGLPASALAGLHVHFFLATLEHARPGDLGAFITAAEWMDVNYGALVRQLLVGRLGGIAVHVIEPAACPFPDAAATAAITCFQVGHPVTSVAVRRVSGLSELSGPDGLVRGRPVASAELAASARWTPLTRPGQSRTSGTVQLGELCRVHRGQVTGANAFWIAGPHVAELPAELPAALLRPAVTRARELFEAGACLRSAAKLRRVIDLPEQLEELDQLGGEARRAVDALLRRARAEMVHRSYVARHRRAWWSVRLHQPAPILATYMARRPPAFVRNLAGARHINIAHGLYPRVPLTDQQLDALARHLSASTSISQGRTYAGGLTKFEPREMERLPVPIEIFSSREWLSLDAHAG